MAAPIKAQLFGHSFVSRLKDFIRHKDELNYRLGLQLGTMVQFNGFPGARARSLIGKMDFVADYSPEILVLLVGTNDLYEDVSVESIEEQICDIVYEAISNIKVAKVIVCQVLHRCEPKIRTRFPVDLHWFNARVDKLNASLDTTLKSRFPNRAFLWRMKGFWSPETKNKNFASDGCHLSDDGQFKLLSNIRAAIIAAHRQSLK
ncbi:hypothetical protein DPMN_076592 [Dreissena polymorpha]|uniref:SGNH hydrolase-type esterase domain-containing protein n=1 Tax=Dreissena polymorpha TaxID=45954 RepID=A0A9D3YMI1_DREPO|nr:hypothetical protein DPMN_076592 [Dreissena polymorpha]